MADALGNVQGKTDSNDAIVVVGQTAGTVPPTGTSSLFNLPGKVDANNQLVVVFV